MTRKTAGELAKKVLEDTTKYDALEVGHHLAEDIEKHLYESIAKHKHIIDEDEFCVVMVIAKDPLLKNVIRRKFFCWPYLPKPRPNQAVFLYNKKQDRITKRLWVLPSDAVMAELASLLVVHKRYKTMQAWSVAFFEGRFWDYIRYEHDINMLSEAEYISTHRDELVKAGCKIPNSRSAEPFDFSKVHIKNVVDTQTPMTNESVFSGFVQAQNSQGSVASH